MELFEAIINLLEVVAWPCSTIVLAVLLRKDIGTLVEGIRLRKAEVPGHFSLEFEKQVERIKEMAPVVQKKSIFQIQGEDLSQLRSEATEKLRRAGLRTSPAKFDFNVYYDMADTDPSASLILLRHELHEMAISILEFRSIDWLNTDSLARKLSRLYQDHAINKYQYSIVQGILQLCNRARFGATITTGQAIDIVGAAEPILKEYMTWVLKDPAMVARVISNETCIPDKELSAEGG